MPWSGPLRSLLFGLAPDGVCHASALRLTFSVPPACRQVVPGSPGLIRPTLPPVTSKTCFIGRPTTALRVPIELSPAPARFRKPLIGRTPMDFGLSLRSCPLAGPPSPLGWNTRRDKSLVRHPRRSVEGFPSSGLRSAYQCPSLIIVQPASSSVYAGGGVLTLLGVVSRAWTSQSTRIAP
jgi:hypothetical protein